MEGFEPLSRGPEPWILSHWTTSCKKPCHVHTEVPADGYDPPLEPYQDSVLPLYETGK